MPTGNLFQNSLYSTVDEMCMHVTMEQKKRSYKKYLLMDDIGMNSFSDIAHVDVHVDELRQIELTVVATLVVETEHPVA